jgi:uncharacterized Tic20 family protein
MNTMSFTHDAPNESERIAVLVAHGGTLFAWFLAPLLVYLVHRHDSRYVEFQALQSLLWSLAGTLTAIATCGVAIPVFLAWHLYAAWRISNGESYEYPVVGDFARGLLS